MKIVCTSHGCTVTSFVHLFTKYLFCVCACSSTIVRKRNTADKFRVHFYDLTNSSALWQLQYCTHNHGNFENCKKSSSPIMMQISIFRQSLQVMASGIEMSTEAETLPVRSIVQTFKWAAVLGNWAEHVRGHAIWKTGKFLILTEKSSFAILTGLHESSSNGNGSWNANSLLASNDSSIECSLGESGRSTYADIDFENSKKSRFAITRISNFSRYWQVSLSILEIGMHVETAFMRYRMIVVQLNGV